MKEKAIQRSNYLSKKVITGLTVMLWLSLKSYSQQKLMPDLSKAKDTNVWTLTNREISIMDNEIYLKEKEGGGMLYLNSVEFSDGKIEFDVKGRNEFQKSFVGIAFHVANDSTYDAVYFRPFNFKTPGREKRSVQYISIPGGDWPELREKFPEKYENSVQPVPEPTERFHVTVEIIYPLIKVYVNGSSEPSLVVNKLNTRKTGKLGFWVGNGSDGYFSNLKITANK